MAKSMKATDARIKSLRHTPKSRYISKINKPILRQTLDSSKLAQTYLDELIEAPIELSRNQRVSYQTHHVH
jgi:hypothetical protein